ncbi:Wadjet anti-phage system protein JetD domain-containing protein [Streptomyces sp. NPDC056453]|uniref:Wadjet anti-phage system protein JetD domain-containing protein n=1 Tax=Streptomyces sp. NPDC056453 TaxID=3345822 RepID=UPI00369CC917
MPGSALAARACSRGSRLLGDGDGLAGAPAASHAHVGTTGSKLTSVLMDRSTLTAHQGQWVKEPKPIQEHLQSLTGEEADLYQSQAGHCCFDGGDQVF